MNKNRLGNEILLVEDSQANRLFIAQILRDAQFSVQEAESVQEALQKFSAGKFIALITDINLKGNSDGWELAQIVAKLDPFMKIIFMSGDPVNEERAREIGLGPFLGKPFLKDQLLSILNDVTKHNTH